MKNKRQQNIISKNLYTLKVVSTNFNFFFKYENKIKKNINVLN